MLSLTLVYQGPLKSNGKAAHKADIRKAFSSQLRRVFDREIGTSPAASEILERCVRTVAGCRYASLVNKVFGLHAELEIDILARDNAGIFAEVRGDVDNRLKTLFDALGIPQESQARSADAPIDDPTICLVEDDLLIRSVCVRVGELLLDLDDPSHVLVIVKATLVRHDSISSTLFVSDET